MYLLLQIYYLDNLEHSQNNRDRMTTPRAALFTGEKVGVITAADRMKGADGKPTYGKLKVSNYHNTL